MIALGTVAAASLATRIGVLVSIALLMTVGVYGLVAAIVKLDDAGLAMSRHAGDGGWPALVRASGRALLRGSPWLMKFLSVAGTAAMFLVGGGILTHGLPLLHGWVESALHASAPTVQTVASVLIDAAVGIIAGLLVLAVVSIVKRLRGPKPAGGHA